MFRPFCTDIQTTTLALDFRVTLLEKNGGSDVNSSVAELEVRVEALEGTALDHETRLMAAQTDIEGKICFQITKSGLSFILMVVIYFIFFTAIETRLTSVEENIQGKHFPSKLCISF